MQFSIFISPRFQFLLPRTVWSLHFCLKRSCHIENFILNVAVQNDSNLIPYLTCNSKTDLIFFIINARLMHKRNHAAQVLLRPDKRSSNTTPANILPPTVIHILLWVHVCDISINRSKSNVTSCMTKYNCIIGFLLVWTAQFYFFLENLLLHFCVSALLFWNSKARLLFQSCVLFPWTFPLDFLRA